MHDPLAQVLAQLGEAPVTQAHRETDDGRLADVEPPGELGGGRQGGGEWVAAHERGDDRVVGGEGGLGGMQPAQEVGHAERQASLRLAVQFLNHPHLRIHSSSQANHSIHHS